MVREKTVAYEGPDGSISITVVRATVLIGARRSVQRVEARNIIEADEDMPHEIKILRGLTYPDLVVCTSGVEGIPWPLSFEDFLDLDDEFVDLWWEAVKQVNPHWYVRPSEESADPKEAKNSIDG